MDAQGAAIEEGALESTASTVSASRNRYLRALRTPAGRIGLFLVLVVVAAGLVGPLLTAASPTNEAYPPLLAPSVHHLLGTDELGRDLWSRVLYGIRVDLLVAPVSVILSAVAGTILGCLSGIYEALDLGISRIFDVLLAFPALVLGLVIAAVLSPGLTAIILTVVIINVPLFGVLARRAVQQQLGREYVLAGRLVGGSRLHVLRRHVFPNIIDPLVVSLALALSGAVFIEGGMSFVGIGVQEPTPSLGNLLNGSLSYLYERPTYAIGPILALSMLMIGLFLLAEAFNRELLRS
jgi:peptide/nickel transport system permease protein